MLQCIMIKNRHPKYRRFHFHSQGTLYGEGKVEGILAIGKSENVIIMLLAFYAASLNVTEYSDKL